MTEYNWRPFLEQWSRAILASPEVEYLGLPPEVIESGWLGLPGASEAQIAAAEVRLGVRLPPSYRSFLLISNGWRHTGSIVGPLRPVEEVDRYGVLYSDSLADFTEGLTGFGAYEYEFDPSFEEADLRHLEHTLVLSSGEDVDTLLLNPQGVAPNGEWEAWSYFGEAPSSYKSFWDLLHAEYDTLLQVSRTLARPVRPSDPPEAVVEKLPGLIAEFEEKIAQFRALGGIGDMGYHKGTADGLRSALKRVRQESKGVRDPQALRAKLAALADALLSEANALQEPLRAQAEKTLPALMNPAPNPLDMLRQLGPMMKSVREAARAEGLRQAAGIIRWYLGES